MEIPEFKNGLYKHYKGNLYWARGLALHTETNEWYVRYVKYDEPAKFEWMRPLCMWNELVETEDGKKSRFEYIPI